MPARQEGCWGVGVGSLGSLPSLCQASVPHSPKAAQHPKYSMESISLPAH